jgi:hypothetical protein
VLLQMLRDGRLHLSGVAALAPHLTEENRDWVLARAARRTKAQLLELIAQIAPRPDVAPSIRRLPARLTKKDANQSPGAAPPWCSAGSAAGVSLPRTQPADHRLDDIERPPGGHDQAVSPVEHRLDDVGQPGIAVPVVPGPHALPDALPEVAGPSAVTTLAGIPSAVSRPLLAGPPTGRRARSGHLIEPLAPGRYRVQFTASAALRAKLERLQVLMARAVPDGDLAVLIEAAVTERIERLERQRLAATKRPRTSLSASDTRPGPRHIPAAVKRIVRERDGDHCAFVDRRGWRCSERRHLEFHHRLPHALGGDRTPRNIARFCARHNAYEALHDLGTKVARSPA